MQGIYKHYKGNIYKVLGVALHSETREELVVYRSVEDENDMWVRPKKMFEEMVEIEGEQVKRFTKQG